MIRLFFFLIAIFVCFSACKENKPTDNKDALVKVNSHILLKSEVQSVVPKGISPADSTLYAENYIKKWIKDELILDVAERNLGDDKDLIENLVNEYRKSLIRYRYQENLVKEKLSGEIQDEDKLTYYNANKDKFILDRNLIRGLFLKIPADAPGLSDVKRWYKSGSVSSLEKIEKYSIQNAAIYEYFYDKWVDFDEIMSNIPEHISNPEDYLRANKTVEVTDSSFCYLLHIREYLHKGQIEPYDYAEPNIQEILINQRKLDFLKKFEEELYNDALKGRDVQFYTKP